MFINIEACGEFHRTKALFSNKQPRFRAGEFPSGSDFGRGQKRFPLRLHILKILCCTLPFYPRPWRGLLHSCISLAQFWGGLVLRTWESALLPTLCHLLQLNPQLCCARICQQGIAVILRAPFVHEDPAGAVLRRQGSHPRFWMSGLEVCTTTDTKRLIVTVC